jgi:hypothetical protein
MEHQNLAKDDIRETLEKLNISERKLANDLLKKLGIDLSFSDPEITHTKVRGFGFQGVFYTAETHREVLLKLAEIVLYNNPNEQDRIFQIRGAKRTYFSKNQEDLSFDYKRINGTDIYAELNENAKTLKKRCQQILLTYGYDLTTFNIKTF